MKRYEIQEMVSQSEQGVAYLAHDKESRRDVALRRFFPFGREAAGLDPEQQNLYRETCRKLMSVTHTNLRFVIDGDVDPSDGTPYLATEWIEGNPLDQILAGATLDPARTIDIVRCALEVSLELSAAFDQQAIWVETGLNSIVVGNVESDRGYTFWVCPLRWFNVAPKLREVSSLAQLAEELIGWSNKLYSKEAAGGFGGWVKDMKSSPDISVEEALKQLNALLSKHQPKLGTTASSLSQPVALVKPTAELSPASTTQSTPPTPKPVPQRHPRPTPKPVPRPVARPAAPAPVLQPTPAAYVPYGASPTQLVTPSTALHQSKSKSITGALAVIAVCLAIASVFGYLVIQNRIKLREQLAKNAAIEKAEAEAKNPANANKASQSVVSQQPTSTGSAPSKPNPVTTGPSANTGDVPVFSADQVSQMRGLGKGKQVKLTGTLFAVRHGVGDAKNIVHLWLDDPEKKGRAAARAVASNFEGALSLELFQKYVGKRIVIEGEYFYDKDWEVPHRVDFTRASQVYLASEQPVPAATPKPTNPPVVAVEPPSTESGVPVFSPSHTNEVIEYANKKVMVKGRLLRVEQADSKTVGLWFTEKSTKGFIYGRAVANKFEGELSPEMFKGFIGKEIVIEGVFMHRRNWASTGYAVEFVRPSQVQLVNGNAAASSSAPERATASGISDVKPAPALPAGVLSPSDADKIMKMDNGAPVKVQGRLLSVGGTNIKGVIVLHFAEPVKDLEYVRGWASEEDFNGELSFGLFKSYIGKTILLDGKCKHMSGRHKPHVVQFNSLDQIKVIGN